MLKSKERPVRVFVGKHLSLRGREEKVTVFPDFSALFDFSFRWIADRSSPDRSPIQPKHEVKAGRGVQENTRQYRRAKEANVICLVFLTNI